MTLENDIHIRKSGVAGRITLTRPDALNAMTYDMCMAIGEALTAWKTDDEIRLVVIDGEGTRSFCSGGDIASLYATGMKGDFSFAQRFWANEYRVNAQIANFPKPYVAIMDGIVMGGGVGISAHGSHRVVTENTLFAMPECAIGLVPDVGGNFLLSRAPGRIGEYLAMTGARLTAADCLVAGIADAFIPAFNRVELIEALEETGDLSFLETLGGEAEPGQLEEQLPLVNHYFSAGSAKQIITGLEAADGRFEIQSAKHIRQGCPLSVACAVEIVHVSRTLPAIEDVLELEYRFTYRSMSDGDFLEGIRAQIIDKDRNPNWIPKSLEALDQSQISKMLKPLEEHLF